MSVNKGLSAVPLYRQLKERIKNDIRVGRYQPGDQLPSEVELQKEYGMSRVTVRNAMSELTSEGYIIKVQGKGSFVATSDVSRLPVGVTSFTTDAKMQGIDMTSEVVKFCIEDINNDFDRATFDDRTGGKVLALKRVRKANGVPISIEENHMSPELQALLDEDLTGSFYELLRTRFQILPYSKGRRTVKIIFADEEIAELLGLSRGTPVIESEMCVYDVDGNPIHTVKDIVRGDNDRFLKWYV